MHSSCSYGCVSVLFWINQDQIFCVDERSHHFASTHNQHNTHIHMYTRTQHSHTYTSSKKKKMRSRSRPDRAYQSFLCVICGCHRSSAHPFSSSVSVLRVCLSLCVCVYMCVSGLLHAIHISHAHAHGCLAFISTAIFLQDTTRG